MKTLIKISSLALLLPAVAMAAPAAFQQGPGQIYVVSGKAVITPGNDTQANADNGMLKFDTEAGSNAPFTATYVIGHKATVKYWSLTDGAPLCEFTFLTTTDGGTTITAAASPNHYREVKCTVDGKASSTSKDPNYSPVFQMTIK